VKIYDSLLKAKTNNETQLAILIDPDGTDISHLASLIEISLNAHVDYFFIGGSLVVNNRMETVMGMLNDQKQIPLVIFPGCPNQVHADADALLLLSLISGRNPDYLIGKHVESAQQIKHSGLEIIPTGYMLIDGGTKTTVNYVSNTQAIPRNEINIAVSTAIAGQLLGLRSIYLEAGSGARFSVPPNMISKVKAAIDIPLIVGGGIRDAAMASRVAQAGADLIVVGNAAEKQPKIITELSIAIHSSKSPAS
jgi:putative glycerol-1-phosphate prenyltransferase